MSKNIQVAIKVRPLLRKEKEQKLTSCWKIHENSIQLGESQAEPFCFDHIFDQDASNEHIFNKMAKHIVHSGIRGFNGTIFAYGQTSSGKTYTMMGDEKNPGVMVLAVKEIFKQIRASDRQFLLRVGYIEIYNERIYDLLNKKNQDLKIHETPSGNVGVNCEECIITCEEELLHLLCVGNKERTVGETNMNERSSRSHAIFRIIIESRKVDRSEDDSVNQSVLNLVDLAGSERADQTGARGTRLKEGGHINKSLLFLSNVIKLLSESTDGVKYISYRDSKLTRILQDSLGGNALTSIICTIKPTAVEETQSTLNFAMRAKSIKNKPQVNEVVSEAAMMKRLEREINMLKNQLAEERSKNKSQIKVGQLEQRIKTEVVKIISSNSLHNLKKTDKRRRTWCSASTKIADTSLVPTALPAEPPSNDAAKNGSSGLPVPSLKKLQIPKPLKYFTPQVSLRCDHREFTKDSALMEARIEELFEPVESTNFEIPPSSLNGSNNSISPKSSENISTVSITPKVTSSVHSKLKIVENALVELEEFTNLENKFDIKHDTSEALKQQFELMKSRNALLENERLEYLALKDEHVITEKNLNDSLKRCEDLENQISKLTHLHESATEKIANYEKLFEELNSKIQQLEVENREAVSLDFEFQRHKNKSKQREAELLEVLEDKNKEIAKLERSLNALSEEKIQNSKEELMQLSRSESLNNSGEICVKCEDLARLLDENKKVAQEFERLSLDHKQLQFNFTQAVENANQTQSKLNALEETHNNDVLECDKLRAEIKAVREKLEQVKTEYDALSTDFRSKSDAYDVLNRVIEEERVKMNELQVKYDRLEAAWQQQQSTIDDIQRAYDAIQLKYQSLQSEYENLELTSSNTLSDCRDLEEKNEALQAEINELKQRVETAQKQLVQGDDSTKTDSLGIELNELKQHNAKLRDELTDVRQQYEEMQKEYDVLSNQLMDQLQDGEELRERNSKLEAQLEVLRKDLDTGKPQTIATSKDQLKARISNLRSELEQLLSAEEAPQTSATTDNERRESVATFDGVTESMRSSGLGLDYVEPPKGQGDQQMLARFAQLAAVLDEVELEYADGQTRIFRASQQAKNTSYRLLIQGIQEIVCRNDNTEEANDGCLHMRGSFARNNFKISEVATTKPSDIESSNEQEFKDSIPLTSSDELELLREENLQLKTLLTSMEQEIDDMRDKMTKLSAELLEKSLFVEKCACQMYQKQIESLEKEHAEMTIFCEELQTKVLDASTRSQRSISSRRSDVFKSAESSRVLKDSKEEGYLDRTYHDRRSSLHCFDKKMAESTPTASHRISDMSVSLCSTRAEDMEADDSKETLKDDENSIGSLEDVTALNKQINELKRKIEELQATIEILTENLAEERNKLHSKEQQVDDLTTKCQDAEKQLIALQTQHVEEMKAFESSKQEELDCKQQEYKIELNRLQLELCGKLEVIETEGRENLRKRRDWEECREKYELTIADLQQKLRETKSLDETPSKREVSVMTENEDQQRNGTSILEDNNSHEKTPEHAAENLQERLELEEEKVRSFQSHLQDLQVKLNESRKASEEYREQLKRTEDRLRDSERELVDCNNKLLLKTDQVKELQLEMEQIVMECKDLADKIEASEKQDHSSADEHNLDDCNKRSASKSDQVEELQLQLDKFLAERENLLDKIKELEKKLEQLAITEDCLRESERNFEDCNKNLALKTEQVKELQLDLDKALVERENLLDKIKVLEEKQEQLKLAEDRLREAEQNLDECKKNLALETDQVKELQLNSKQLLVENKKLSDRISVLEKENNCNQAEDRLRESEQKLVDCKEKLLLKTDEIKELRLQIDKLFGERRNQSDQISALEKLSSDHQESLNIRNAEVEALKTAHAQLLENKQELEFHIKSLQTDKSKLLVECESLQKGKNEIQSKFANWIEEKQQLEISYASLKREKQNAEKKLNELEDNEAKQKLTIKELREQLKHFDTINAEYAELQNRIESLNQNLQEKDDFIKELREQLKKFENLPVENVKLEQKIVHLRQKHDESLMQLHHEKEELMRTLMQNRAQQADAEERVETLQLKIETLLQDLHEVKQSAANYEKLLLDYNEVSQALEVANEEKKTSANKVKHLQEQLRSASAETQAACKRNKVLEDNLIAAQSKSTAAIGDAAKLSKELEEMREKLGDDHNQLQHERREMQSTIEELQLKCRKLMEHNERLQQTSANAEEHLRSAKQQLALSATYRSQLETLQMEKEELRRQLTVSAEGADKCSRKLCDDAARQKELLDQQVEAYNKLRHLLDAKESTFKDEKKKLEGTIECLLAKEKTLEERLYATEVALKKCELSSNSKRRSESPKNADSDLNASHSPRKRRSNDATKPSTLSLEEKLSSERKNRRLSSHDERRRHSLWNSYRDMATITDPTDPGCRCIELDRKLQLCERNLFIRESQVTALNMQIKNNPFKYECNMLKKRLQEEQERSSNEIKKYKQIILEQKMRATKSLPVSSKENVTSVAVQNAPTLAHVESQTDAEWESRLHKLEAKYNDLKNICRFRHSVIRELEEKVASLSRQTSVQPPSGGDQQLSSLELGEIRALKEQCVSLKKELYAYKHKYEDARKYLDSRREEIKRLRAQLDVQSE